MSKKTFAHHSAKKNLVSAKKAKKMDLDLAPSNVHTPSADAKKVTATDLPPPPRDYAQPQKNPTETAAQEALRGATYAHAHPAPQQVRPSREALETMTADPYHAQQIAKHGSDMNKVAIDVITTAGNPNRMHPSDAPRLESGPPRLAGFTLADLAAAGMSTGRR